MTFFDLRQPTTTIPNPLPISNGGTGAQTATTALTNLGAAPVANPLFTGVPIAPVFLIRSDTTARIGQLHLSGDLATTGASQFYFDGWNSPGNATASPAFIARTGRGTQASPRRTLNNDQLFGVAARGCYAADNSAIATIESGGRAGVFMFAAEDHTSVGQGSRLEVHTTAIGTSAKATAAIFGADKSLTVSGSVTATTFTGSGTGLTAIPQTGVTGLVAELAAKEPLLGNPAVDGRVLSSSASGVRQWVSLLAADHSSLQNRDVAGNHAKLIPVADGVGAVQITKADGVSAVLSIDTATRRTGLNIINIETFNNVAPQTRLDVGGYLRLRQDQEYLHTYTSTTSGSDRYINSASLGPLILTNRNVVGDGIMHNIGIHWNLVEDWEPYSETVSTLTPVVKYADSYYGWDYAAFFGLTPTGDFIWKTALAGVDGTPVTFNPTALTITNNGNVGIGLDPNNAITNKLDIKADSIRLRDSRTPVSATEPGNPGEICWNTTHLYVCVAPNKWKRAALTTW